ncbi:MAG: leucine-rich repeat protein [Lachnospiraceae bacterium]|nr:leucine-rich repeat protein [Lachnospiraceae bacterium]
MRRKLQKIKRNVLIFIMSAALGVCAPAQSIPAHAQENAEPTSEGIAAENAELIPASIAAENAEPTSEGIATENAEPTSESIAIENAEPEYIVPESVASAQAASDYDDIQQSEDEMWYYTDRSLADGGTGIVIRGRDHVGEEEETGIVSRYTENGVEKLCYTIPDKIDGKSVTAIGNFDRWYLSDLTEDAAHCAFIGLDAYDLVVVPEGVDTIYDFCFYQGSFKKVKLPETLKDIGVYAFESAENLAEINIPDAVEAIGRNAFDYTPWLDKIREEASQKQEFAIVNHILLLGDYVIGDAHIPAGVKIISSFAVAANGYITSVTIPDSVVDIADNGFNNCHRLASITLGKGVEKIGRGAFANTKIEELSLPDSVREIDDSICDRCEELKSVRVGENITELPNYTFEDCTSLQTISLPEGLQSIGAVCFDGCTSLQTISLPEGLQSIGEAGFYGCESLEELTLPEHVTEIGDKAFYGCSNISKLTLPADLTKLGEDAFRTQGKSDGYQITLTVPEALTDISGLELSKHRYALIRVVEGGLAEAYLRENKLYPYLTYKPGCEKIDAGTQTVTEPPQADEDDTQNPSGGQEQGTQKDGETKGNNIYIDNSTTTIDRSTTNIDQSTTNIDQSTTNIDQSDTTVIYNPPEEKTSAEEKKPAPESLAGKVFTYKKCKYQIGADEKTVTFVCANNKKRKTLTIPDKVTYQKKKFKVVSVAKNACKGMKKLRTVTIGAYVECIEQKAFYNCTKLKTVTIGKRVEEIGKMAFYGDSALKKLTFKNMKVLKSVDAAAFYLRGSRTDKHLKKKSTSKKLLLAYLKNSGVKVTAK